MPKLEFDRVLALSTAALRVLGTGRLREPAILREGPRAYPCDAVVVRSSISPSNVDREVHEDRRDGSPA